MNKRHVIAIALGMILVFGVSLSGMLGKGKPGSNNPHADGIFDDSPSYKITGDIELSDSNYTFPYTLYADGEDGVINTINMSTIDPTNPTHGGDYIQNLGTLRYVIIDLSDRFDGAPSTLSLHDTLMNVKAVGIMDSVGTHVGAVTFETGLGQIRFGNVEDLPSGLPDPKGSSSVSVERISTSPPTWDVSTNSYPDDVAALVQTVKGKTVINKYHLPFHMIIKQK